MPRYLAVIPVQTEGRPVPAEAAAADGGPPAVPEGSRLVAVVNNGEWQSALDVTYPDNYAALRKRCRDGVWKEMRLYLLDEERAAAIEDGRRILMNGQPVRDPGRMR